ncbi:hypothetical protein PR048_012114 [Dryococelus australis]|uniref:Uncharacterized protein n=1 Tax=Dryococelus australis TaxID=614101 RepID=A0ABQ9HPQ5_9NEOP|nr:hypothetical protein PR048_012114 [Dryococelus australis]
MGWRMISHSNNILKYSERYDNTRKYMWCNGYLPQTAHQLLFNLVKWFTYASTCSQLQQEISEQDLPFVHDIPGEGRTPSSGPSTLGHQNSTWEATN